MNELTSQVVERSKLAEQAGIELDGTQTTTCYYAQIAQKVAQGVSIQNRRTSVNETADHLQEQTNHTTKLMQQALSLVKAVSVFTLKRSR